MSAGVGKMSRLGDPNSFVSEGSRLPNLSISAAMAKHSRPGVARDSLGFSR